MSKHTEGLWEVMFTCVYCEKLKQKDARFKNGYARNRKGEKVCFQCVVLDCSIELIAAVADATRKLRKNDQA